MSLLLRSVPEGLVRRTEVELCRSVAKAASLFAPLLPRRSCMDALRTVLKVVVERHH